MDPIEPRFHAQTTRSGETLHIVERPWSGRSSCSVGDRTYPVVVGSVSSTSVPFESARGPGNSKRPRRRMPSMAQIARHHGFDRSTPLCIRCGRVPDDYATWGDTSGLGLQRAHIIDRVFSGLDNPSNLLPLCWRCHRQQPIFKAGDEAEALDWFIGEPNIYRYQTGEAS